MTATTYIYNKGRFGGVHQNFNHWVSASPNPLYKIVLLLMLIGLVSAIALQLGNWQPGHGLSLSTPEKDYTARLLDACPGIDQNEEAFPAWIEKLCPESVAHFKRFPYFTFFVDGFSLMTSAYAALLVCTMKLASEIAASIDAPIYLHAGSHLGSILHGGPIPWDDDADMFMRYEAKDLFLERCNNVTGKDDLSQLGVKVRCFPGDKGLKMHIIAEGSIRNLLNYTSPFLDIFFFSMNGSHLYEVWLNGTSKAYRRPELSYRIKDYFPTRPFYFGGIVLFGPQERIPLSRYDPEACISPKWNHRREWFNHGKRTKYLDCAVLRKALPFLYSNGSRSIIYNGYTTWNVPQHLRHYINKENGKEEDYDGLKLATSLWGTSPEDRETWAKMSEKQGQILTDTVVPNINKVEIDNSIAEKGSCDLHTKRSMTIVEFNAERGRHWLDSVGLLEPLHADIIILNEMDIGMARSDQQHTTRVLAKFLGMNYVWGLEFVELTRGNKYEQEVTNGTYNFLGLHGNAILSKCPFYDPIIFRNEVGVYFSDKKTFKNANGYEKRLGGRMILLARMQGTSSNGGDIVVGSTHTLQQYSQEITKYINQSPAVIAGDQDWGFCERVGLHHADDKKHNTWPASCESRGRMRGDILCVDNSMEVIGDDRTQKPCVETSFGEKVGLGDHAVVSVTVSLR